MTIKQHHNCSEGRHVFIPTRWQADITKQQRWVTEFSCQHCLYFVSSEEWYDILNEKYVSRSPEELNTTLPADSARGTVFEIQGKPIQAAESIKITNVTQPLDLLYAQAEADMLKSCNAKVEKKRGRPFAKK